MVGVVLAPLVELPQRSPFHRHQLTASTQPTHRWACPSWRCRSKTGPSMSFLPTSTVSSAVCLAGLLHPAADRRVRPVSGPRPTRLSTSRTADRPHGRPSLRSVPPSSSRIPCHQGAFPLAVATTRLRRLRACREAVGLRALLHRRVRCTHAALPRRGARCSLGISSMIGLSPAGNGGTVPGL